MAPHVTSGALRLLGSSGARRAAAAPDVPTFAEQGIDGYAVSTWYGIVAPAKTPADILAKLASALNEIRNSPEVRERLPKLGAEPMAMTPGEFDALVREELRTNAVLVKAAGIQPN